MTIYGPLRSEDQITDAMGLYKKDPQELARYTADQKELTDRIVYITAHIDQVKVINGHEIINPVIAGDKVYYTILKNGEPLRCYYPIQYAYIFIDDGKQWQRKLSNKELADLPEAWENAKIDTTKYIQTACEVWEVDGSTYAMHKATGDLCQVFEDKYYIA